MIAVVKKLNVREIVYGKGHRTFNEWLSHCWKNVDSFKQLSLSCHAWSWCLLIYSGFEFRHIIRNLTYLHSPFISYLKVFLWITWLNNHTFIQGKFRLSCMNFIIIFYLYSRQDIMKPKTKCKIFWRAHIYKSYTVGSIVMPLMLLNLTLRVIIRIYNAP